MAATIAETDDYWIRNPVASHSMRPDNGAQILFLLFLDCNGTFWWKRIVFFADILYRKALSKADDFGFSREFLAQI